MLLKFNEKIKDKLLNSDYRIIVTGAGGWVGLATLEMLDEVFGNDFSDRVIGVVSRPRKICLRSGKDFELVDFASLRDLRQANYLIAHYAFLTRDKIQEHSDFDYITKNRALTEQLIKLVEGIDVRGILTVSSGAVYNKDRSLVNDIEANPYGFLKLEEEKHLGNLAIKNNLNLSICRLFNLSGPFIHKEFALNSIILDVLSGRDVTIKAKNRVVRDFMYVGDLVSVGFSIVLDQHRHIPAIYDSGIGKPIEIGNLAEKVIELLTPKKLEIKRPDIISEENYYAGDTQSVEEICKFYSIEQLSLDRQIFATAEFLKN